MTRTTSHYPITASVVAVVTAAVLITPLQVPTAALCGALVLVATAYWKTSRQSLLLGFVVVFMMYLLAQIRPDASDVVDPSHQSMVALSSALSVMTSVLAALHANLWVRHVRMEEESNGDEAHESIDGSPAPWVHFHGFWTELFPVCGPYFRRALLGWSLRRALARGIVVLVIGPPRSGKSRLLQVMTPGAVFAPDQSGAPVAIGEPPSTLFSIDDAAKIDPQSLLQTVATATNRGQGLAIAMQRSTDIDATTLRSLLEALELPPILVDMRE